MEMIQLEEGCLRYSRTSLGCNMIFDKLLKEAQEAQQQYYVVGFETLWTKFPYGDGKTAVIQICTWKLECYVMSIDIVKKLPEQAINFFAASSVRLVGTDIYRNMRKLTSDFKGIKFEDVIIKCIDIQEMAGEKLNLYEQIRLEHLVEYCLRSTLNKDRFLRMSRWDVIPLTTRQLIYAATDPYICMKLFHYLTEIGAEDKVYENRRYVVHETPLESERNNGEATNNNINDDTSSKSSYAGDVWYSETFEKCSALAETLLKKVHELCVPVVVGFNSEWQQGKVTLVQIDFSLSECYIFILRDMQSIPKNLSDFLLHPNVQLAGINIKNDIQKLGDQFVRIKPEQILSNCIEAEVMANSKLHPYRRWCIAELCNPPVQRNA